MSCMKVRTPVMRLYPLMYGKIAFSFFYCDCNVLSESLGRWRSPATSEWKREDIRHEIQEPKQTRVTTTRVGNKHKLKQVRHFSWNQAEVKMNVQVHNDFTGSVGLEFSCFLLTLLRTLLMKSVVLYWRFIVFHQVSSSFCSRLSVLALYCLFCIQTIFFMLYGVQYIGHISFSLLFQSLDIKRQPLSKRSNNSSPHHYHITSVHSQWLDCSQACGNL